LGKFDEENIHIDLGRPNSLHNPAGGYYPVGISFEEYDDGRKPSYSRRKYKKHCENTLTLSINTLLKEPISLITEMLLLEASRAGADIMAENNIDFRYPSYVQDIMGPMCFDFGFGPWVCASGKKRFTKNRYHCLRGTGRNGKTALLKFSNKCKITFNG
jgi:urocanate hydratase